jgi:tetratricopeptide (TPR) repeat protein
MTGPNLKHLVEQARSARLVRVLGVYIIASYAILQAVDLLIAQFGLPAWFFPVGLGLLLLGLPVLGATAVIQAHMQKQSEPAAADPAPVDSAGNGVRRLFTWRLAFLGGVLAFLALGSVGATVVWLRIRAHELRPDAVAVMPFHVVGDEVELWREGMVDLLGAALNATGQFHASDPRAVINRWHRLARDPEELPEPDIAAEVAGSLGASRVILGSVIKTGSNGVRLSADLYSVRWRRKEASAAVEGSEDQMTALVDRLTLDLLRSIWRGDSMPEVRVSAMTTTSIPALRAYLEGEQAFRHSQFAEAQAALNQAIEHDSAFAIAHYRLAHAYGWSFGLGAGEISRHLSAALRHSQGLSERDSLLIRGWKLADVDGSLAAIPLFNRLTTRYPDDVEAWHGLGDALFHMGAQDGEPLIASVEPMERALELDSSFAPALIHLVEIAYATDDSTRGREWTERYLALDSTSIYAQSFRLLTPLHFGSPADSARAAAVLDTASSQQLSWMLARMRGTGTPMSLYQRIALAGADPRFTDDERHMPLWFLGLRYMKHGQVSIALDLIQQSMALSGGGMDRAALNLISTAREVGLAVDSTSLQLVERLASRYDYMTPSMAVQAAQEGRSEEAAAVVAELEAIADTLLAQGDSARARSMRGRAWTLRGRIAAAHDSIDEAIANLRRGLSMINATWTGPRDLDRYWLAHLIQDRDGEEEAISVYGSLYWNPWAEAMAYLHRAELHERRGELDEAARYYARFIDMWADADDHLQPRVEAARRALERIRGQRIAS